MFNDNTPTCEHIKTNGIRCGSPALQGQTLCYFHERHLRDFPQYRTAAPNLPTPFDFPYPEDADSIQYTIALVMRSLMNGTIDQKSAGLMLYALQTAANNVKNTVAYRRALRLEEDGETRGGESPLLTSLLQRAEADMDNADKCVFQLKRREDEVSRREAELAERETALKQREQALRPPTQPGFSPLRAPLASTVDLKAADATPNSPRVPARPTAPCPILGLMVPHPRAVFRPGVGSHTTNPQPDSCALHHRAGPASIYNGSSFISQLSEYGDDHSCYEGCNSNQTCLAAR